MIYMKHYDTGMLRKLNRGNQRRISGGDGVFWTRHALEDKIEKDQKKKEKREHAKQHKTNEIGVKRPAQRPPYALCGSSDESFSVSSPSFSSPATALSTSP